MTSREKIMDIERQIRAMEAGELTDFYCPFCKVVTTEGNGILCCNEAAEVINAILDYIEFKQGVELIDQIMDRFSAAESKVILN